MQPLLNKISPHIIADDKKSGGSMMRIYRDVRFSKDKRPYNEHLSMIFYHSAGKKAPAPGFYLRADTTDIAIGAGIWQPPTPVVNQIREGIVADSNAWKRVRDDAKLRKVWGSLDGESLKRPPRGFDADHPFIEDLKRKDFVVFRKLTHAASRRSDFATKIASNFQDAMPLMKFLSKKLNQPI